MLILFFARIIIIIYKNIVYKFILSRTVKQTGKIMNEKNSVTKYSRLAVISICNATACALYGYNPIYGFLTGLFSNLFFSENYIVHSFSLINDYINYGMFSFFYTMRDYVLLSTYRKIKYKFLKKKETVLSCVEKDGFLIINNPDDEFVMV